MEEVELLARLADLDGVPAHVRDLEPRRLDLLHHAVDEAETFGPRALLAAVEEDLQADADAEQRLAGGDRLLEHGDQAALFEVLHAVAKGADARQHDLRGLADHAFVTRHADVRAERDERLLGAEEIADAVINDCNHGILLLTIGHGLRASPSSTGCHRRAGPSRRRCAGRGRAP